LRQPTTFRCRIGYHKSSGKWVLTPLPTYPAAKAHPDSTGSALRFHAKNREVLSHLHREEKSQRNYIVMKKTGAGEGIRTLAPNLGKQQITLSTYSFVILQISFQCARARVLPVFMGMENRK
ncbi:MAG: hypothetical protein QM650_18255, partial [Microlunatus sp.]